MSKPSVSVITSFALAGVGPAAVAAYMSPAPWTIVAAAVSAVAATGLFVVARRATVELAAAEAREKQAAGAVAAAEAKLLALEARIRESAAQDDVSGTLNRRAFLTRLDEAIRRDARLQKPMAFVLVDVEAFKKINAEAGRMIGDRVLRTVGRAIQASTRGTDFVGRIGGDEFAVVLGECVDPRPAVDRIFVALHGETTGGDHPLPIQVSVGVVRIDPKRAAVDPVMLFRIAEEALASVRGAGIARAATRDYPVMDPAPRPVELSSAARG